MAIPKAAERTHIKEQIWLEAADRYAKSVKSGFKSTEQVDRHLKNQRQVNYVNRESAKSRLGITEDSEAMFRMEEAQIDSWDAEDRPPHKIAEDCGKPVARILDSANEQKRGFGTGFLVSDKLFVTNYHVFPDPDYAIDCRANFGFEYDAAHHLKQGYFFGLDPDAFFLNNKKLDFAIVGIADRSDDGKVAIKDQGCIRMIDTPGKIIEGSDINIIQYPLGSYKQYACKQNHVLKILDSEGYVQYKTDTAKAVSGAPGFNKSWELSILHHCAIPLEQNGQIIDIHGKPWNHIDENDVRWIANEGISISAIITYLKEHISRFDTPNIGFLSQLLGAIGDPILKRTTNENCRSGNGTIKINTAAKRNTTLSSTNNNNMSPNVFNFYGSTIMYIGMPSAASNGMENGENGHKQLQTEEAIPSIKFDEDYDSREDLGYNKKFLKDYQLSLPRIDESRISEMYREDGQVMVFKYYNYSLAMNKKRRMCMWTAVNVDYNQKSEKSRKEFGRDTWRSDPRLDDMYQILKKELYDPAKNIDLGHIVRREDACWGKDEQYIEYANSDTFHMTNCTPQHEAFNRANPPKEEGYEGIHGVWGALEEHIKKELKNVDNLATIFAGPSLAKNDPVEDFGHGPIKYPLKFWKVICVCDEKGKLLSYGFWLDQSKVVEEFGLGVERLDFDKFKKQQIPIREITERTNVIFDSEIYNTDVLINNPFNESSDPGISYKTVQEIQIWPK